MCQCWLEDPVTRLTFEAMVRTLQDLLHQNSHARVVEGMGESACGYTASASEEAMLIEVDLTEETLRDNLVRNLLLCVSKYYIE